MKTHKQSGLKGIFLVVVALFAMAGCTPQKAEVTPTPGATQPKIITSYGNMINGGAVATDGNGGIFYSDPADGRVVHLDKEGVKSAVGDIRNSYMLDYNAGALFFCGDMGTDASDTPVMPGLYRYENGSARKIISGSVICYTVTDRVIYAKENGVFSVALDGTDMKKLRSGNITQISRYADKLYFLEVLDEQLCITENDMNGALLSTLATDVSGSVNATDKGLYFLGSDGIFYMEYGQEAQQVVYGEGITGVNAVDDGVYYISSSMGEPALCKLKEREADTVIPPSKFVEVTQGPYIVNTGIYYIAEGAIYSASPDGTEITRIG
jgi:hypothetical protein